MVSLPLHLIGLDVWPLYQERSDFKEKRGTRRKGNIGVLHACMHFAKGSVESTHKVPTRDQPLPLSTTLLVGTPLLISKIGILSIFVVVVLRSPRRGSWGGRAEFLGARSFRHDLVSATALTIGGAHKPLNGDLRGFFGSRKGFFRYITTTTYLDAIMLYHIQYHDQYNFVVIHVVIVQNR